MNKRLAIARRGFNPCSTCHPPTAESALGAHGFMTCVNPPPENPYGIIQPRQGPPAPRSPGGAFARSSSIDMMAASLLHLWRMHGMSLDGLHHHRQRRPDGGERMQHTRSHGAAWSMGFPSGRTRGMPYQVVGLTRDMTLQHVTWNGQSNSGGEQGRVGARPHSLEPPWWRKQGGGAT